MGCSDRKCLVRDLDPIRLERHARSILEGARERIRSILESAAYPVRRRMLR
jgi:hypothetical protein